MKQTETTNPGKKKHALFLFIAAWITCLLVIAAFEPVSTGYFGRKILPSWDDYIPFQVKKIAGSLTVQPVEKSTAVKNNLYTGDNYKHLEKFFKKLSDLEKKGGTVRIYHTGDSQIARDNLTGRLKRNFQKDFGDGGRGIVNPRHTEYTRLTDHVNPTPDSEFILRDVYCYPTRSDAAPELGFIGSSSIPRSPMSSTVHKAPENGAPWKSVDIYLRSPLKLMEATAKYIVNIEYNGTKQTKEIELGADKTGKLHFDVPDVKTISMNLNGTKGLMPYVDGINFESGKGVAYTTSVCTGYEITWLGWIPPRHLEEGMVAYGPDLLLYNFGGNEASRLLNFDNYNRDILIRDTKDFLMRMKKHNPDADIILVAPLEFLLKNRIGVREVFKQQQEVRDIFHQIAKELGLGYYDMYTAAGGEGHLLRFLDAGLATTDYVHLSLKGADHMGDIFYKEIMDTYKGYQKYSEKIAKQNLALMQEKKDRIINFDSASFAWFFIAVLIFLNFIVRIPALKIFILLAASYGFFAGGLVWPLVLIFVSVMLNYFWGVAITWQKSLGENGTRLLALSVILNVSALFVFRYFDFTSQIANTYIGTHLPVLYMALPVAVSFYTLEAISYCIDVWRGDIRAETSFFKFALFLSFFPNIAAGPIVRARQFLTDLKDGRHFEVTSEKVSLGVFLIICGLIKKIGADYLAFNFVDKVFANPALFSSVEILTGLYGYGMHLYCTFSGYADIAVGCAMLLGFQLPENFMRPFQSSSITDFCSRWFITVNAWFRDYVYISFGGSKKRVYFNLMAAAVFCGIWYSAEIKFIALGLFFGTFLVIERASGFLKREIKTGFVRFIRIFITLQILIFGFMIFRLKSWADFTALKSQLFTMTTGVSNIGLTIIIPVVLFYIWHMSPISLKDKLKKVFNDAGPLLQGGFAALITVFLYNIAIADFMPFIYLRF